MRIERDELPPLPDGERVAGAKRRSGEGAVTRAFVILGRSSREAACADPRIHAVTFSRKAQAVQNVCEARHR